MTTRPERKPTVWVTGDQLTPRAAHLAEFTPGDCRVLMIESLEHARRIPYHPQKLVLVWAAMRHFAEELRALGYEVDYYKSEPSFRDALALHIKRYAPPEIVLLESAEHGLSDYLAAEAASLDRESRVVPNNMFLSDKAAFQRESRGKQSRLMEAFYRAMRKQTGLLMDGDDPAGGQWNYDKENRKPPGKQLDVPPVPSFSPGKTTQGLMGFVAKEFRDHFGRVEGFAWPVTRTDAEALRDHFLDQRLDLFGPYQDAMAAGECVLFHSLLSPLLNLGLLEPLDLCCRAEARYREGRARLSSVEGFIRQIIGWREFVYQVYHWQMPAYRDVNFFEADLPLPDFYWTADTDMRCIREAVTAVLADGINHHIQRLMLTGNFALIAGLNPQAVNEWYWFAYVDAHEWVVTPNVLGMALYADGGTLGTKPYAASANYIHRMSDYCAGCAYDPKDGAGEKACPFNALYWDFLARNDSKLRGNQRMAMMYRNLDRQDPDRLKALRKRAGELRKRLAGGERV